MHALSTRQLTGGEKKRKRTKASKIFLSASCTGRDDHHQVGRSERGRLSDKEKKKTFDSHPRGGTTHPSRSDMEEGRAETSEQPPLPTNRRLGASKEEEAITRQQLAQLQLGTPASPLPNLGAAITLCVHTLQRSTEQTGKQPTGIIWPEMIRRGRQVSKDWNQRLRGAEGSVDLKFDITPGGEVSKPGLGDVIDLCIDVLRHRPPTQDWGCIVRVTSSHIQREDATWYEVLQRLCLTNTLNARRRIGIARHHGLVAMQVDRFSTRRLYYGDLMEPPGMAPPGVATQVYRAVQGRIMENCLRELGRALSPTCHPEASAWDLGCPSKQAAGCTMHVCRCPTRTSMHWEPFHVIQSEINRIFGLERTRHSGGDSESSENSGAPPHTTCGPAGASRRATGIPKGTRAHRQAARNAVRATAAENQQKADWAKLKAMTDEDDLLPSLEQADRCLICTNMQADPAVPPMACGHRAHAVTALPCCICNSGAGHGFIPERDEPWIFPWSPEAQKQAATAHARVVKTRERLQAGATESSPKQGDSCHHADGK